MTDRILDMCRTSVNVYSDTVAAIIIDNSEGGSPYSLELKRLNLLLEKLCLGPW